MAQNRNVEIIVSPAVSRVRRADDEVNDHVLVKAVVCLNVS
jgi:hypothetical protein